MITLLPESVVLHCKRISNNDPFQLATPVWLSTGFLSLLPESEYTPTLGEAKHMPVKLIAVSSAPARKIVRTPAVPELVEVIEAIKKMKPSDAIEVTLCKDTETRYSKSRDGKKDRNPAKQLASALKRKFAALAVPYTAYTPDGRLVIVVKEK